MNAPYHLLMIEDDPAVGRSLQEGLQRDGYQVTWRQTGAEGLRAARENAPHLVLLDVRLPDGSGFDFCRQLRQMGLRQPVIVLTVQADEVDKVLGLEMGADDYVTKPFSLRELLSRVRAQLRRAYGEYSNGQAEQWWVGDVWIEQSSGRVRRGDQEVLLTPIEFRLLVFLARHPGQALTRAQIFEAVWGASGELESERAINVHIRRLREKIEPDPSQPRLLLTVPGVGYRLVN